MCMGIPEGKGISSGGSRMGKVVPIKINGPDRDILFQLSKYFLLGSNLVFLL